MVQQNHQLLCELQMPSANYLNKESYTPTRLQQIKVSLVYPDNCYDLCDNDIFGTWCIGPWKPRQQQIFAEVLPCRLTYRTTSGLPPASCNQNTHLATSCLLVDCYFSYVPRKAMFEPSYLMSGISYLFSVGMMRFLPFLHRF